MKKKKRTSYPLKILPFGTFEIDERGIVINHVPASEDLSSVSKSDVIGRNFFTDIAPCDELQEFDCAAFINGSELMQMFQVVGTEILFFRLDKIAFVTIRSVSVARKIEKELNAVEPKFSISKDGRLLITM